MKTIKLDISDEVLRNAEAYAKKKKRNLEELIKDYLESLVTDQASAIDDIAPEVRELPKGLKAPKTTDYKEAKIDYLIKKHLS